MKSQIIQYFFRHALIPLMCGLGYVATLFFDSGSPETHWLTFQMRAVFAFVPVPYIICSLLTTLLVENTAVLMGLSLGASLLLVGKILQYINKLGTNELVIVGTILLMGSGAALIYEIIIPDEHKSQNPGESQ
jgi:hypothetical protein